jgi:hypothetical protein
MTIDAGDEVIAFVMPDHITDSDDEPPTEIERNGDAENDAHMQADLDDAKLRNHKRLNRALLGIGATLDKRKWWEDEGVPGLAKRQV